jgi:hypothetical protein
MPQNSLQSSACATRLVTALIVVLLSSAAWARDKTDVIFLTNGDRLTGEIRQLEHGKLVVSTDSLGQVLIEWDDIAKIESDFEFQFERTDGTRVTGTILKSVSDREIVLTNGEETASFAYENIVRVSQIERGFWEQLKGSLTFGYSFTKASNVAQGNLGFHATHRTEIRSFSLDGSTIITSDQANEGTQRSNLNFDMTRFRKNRWFNSYLLGFESNDELGLNLRSSLGAGIGRYLIQTNTSELALIGGAVGTAEALAGDVSSQENLEGLLGLDYSRYIFDDPTVDLAMRLAVYPSITDSGRTRAQFDINLRWEMIKDLFWDLNFYNTYDSDPPSGSLSTNDYGVVTSIGWSF